MRKMVMRLFFAVGLLVVQQSVFVQQAQCEPVMGGPYLSAKLGIAGYENARLEQSGTIQGADFLGNYFTSVAGGYSWNFFRVELEGAFRYYDAENLDVEVVSSSSSDISSESFTFMANGYIDFKFFPVYPYIMGGVGVAVVDIEGFALGSVDTGYDVDAALAYQFGGGIGISVFDDSDLVFEYRYTRSNDLRFKDVFGVPFHMRYGTHVVSIGVNARF